ncbi:cytochrome b561 and DOMON domain-containing protein At5g47530-like [Impatiens glandulifera]|uniref:cytochrome b561 and DOMON domain-containing protein At5g47530-like n=1 Tax=Impatiens glandulifera TaxID=253017 RepID=UPI001FB0F4C5|nr:cytochrome b561 and DOMON domain-containing protein At5g47530-like [Impatiens glandulifera]
MEKPTAAAATSIFLFLFLLISSSSAQTCNIARTFTGNRLYSTCSTLPVLDSSLYWNYHQANHTVDIAYTHSSVTTSNWVAWALNINGSRMIGAECLVAFQGSAGMRAYTSPITSYQTTLAEGPLSFAVSSISSEFLNNNEIIILATLQLPAGTTTFNHLWQVGPLSGDTPGTHNFAAANLGSMGSVDFSTGAVVTTGGASISRRQKDRNIHGVLNAVSWGVLMPFGAMVARYLKVFKSADPAWFYIHVTCQTSAYIIGVAGWGTGLKLGEQAALQNTIHRNIGIALFCLGTLQVFALLLRPNKDHKYRFYWNMYHWGMGYAVIILTIINIFKGFEMLNVAKGWKRAYIGVLIFFAVNVVLLECYTWYIVMKRKKDTPSAAGKKYPYAGNGNENGVRSTTENV